MFRFRIAITGTLPMKELLRTASFICTLDFWRMAVFWSLSLLYSYMLLFVRTLGHGEESNSFSHCKSQFFASGAIQNPICIITGATSGLGAATAGALAKEGFFVILVGRSKHMLFKTMLEIRKEHTDAKLQAFETDMTSFSSISKFKASLEQWLRDMGMHSSVQLLINNAGILATSYRCSKDGLEEMMATNYTGAFYLTKIMLPLLMKSPVPSRIVNVSSFTHRNVKDMPVDTEYITGKCFSKARRYPFSQIYQYSKTCLLLFSYHLHRQLRSRDDTCHVSVNASDPGSVKTNIMREVPPYLSELAFFVLKVLGLLHCPESGASSILDASLAPPGTSGKYFFGGNGATLRSSALSEDLLLGEKLWRTSTDILYDLKLISAETSPHDSL